MRAAIATFEEHDVPEAEMAARIEALQPWLVAEQDEQVVGYAYASPWRARMGYRRTMEVTVYLAPDACGRGVGSALYADLLDRLRGEGVHAAMATIALPNEASVRLHERFGFTKVGHLREVGLKFGRWVDVGLWEALL